MTRDELFNFCDSYVYEETQAVEAGSTDRSSPDPTTTIIHCFRDAEISAAEMQSLLAYVCQNINDDLDWVDADRFCDGSDGVGRLENPGNTVPWTVTEGKDDSIASRRPRQRLKTDQ